MAAFVGGSNAAGTADEHSDLDLYTIVEDEAFDDFFAERQTFVHHLGPPVFLKVFDGFGWEMVVFVFGNGVEGELALARESRFEHIHGGPFEVVVDRKGILAQKVLPLYELAEPEQRRKLCWLVHWFWHELYKFGTAMARGRLWSAYGHLETCGSSA